MTKKVLKRWYQDGKFKPAHVFKEDDPLGISVINRRIEGNSFSALNANVSVFCIFTAAKKDAFQSLKSRVVMFIKVAKALSASSTSTMPFLFSLFLIIINFQLQKFWSNESTYFLSTQPVGRNVQNFIFV